jgi:thioredoxin 1
MIDVNQDNFNGAILNADKMVVLDFWSKGCATCLNNVNPIIEQLDNEFGEKILFAKVDAYEQAGIAIQLKVRNLPTVLFVKNGEVVDKLTGPISYQQVLQKLDL